MPLPEPGGPVSTRCSISWGKEAYASALLELRYGCKIEKLFVSTEIHYIWYMLNGLSFPSLCLPLLLMGWIGVAVQQGAVAQGLEPQVIQFYGIVFYEDSLSGAVGAHIYHPKTYRGASTDLYGYFSLPVAVGDTMKLSYQGYKPQWILIEEVEGDSYSRLFYLEPDTIQLQAIDITPYMSEQEFKSAVLALGNSLYLRPMTRNLDPSLPRVSSSVNYLYLVHQQQLQRNMRYNPSYVPVTDIVLKPLIKAIRRKKKRKTPSK